VALVLTGSISDGGWNQQAYEGVKQIDGHGFKTAFTENVKQSDIPQVVRGYADDGYDLIIGHGFQFGSLFQEIGGEYAKQKFFATTFAPSGMVPPNVMYIDTRPYDVGYCMGALAALMSASGKAVGLVGGGDNPTQQNMSKVFKVGAEATVPGLKAFAIVTGDYNDAAKGRETALAMIGNGADVITHTADLTGIGAIKGAAEAKVKVIGAFSDQTSLAPTLMGTSIVNNNLGIIVKVAEMAKDGTFEGGKEWKPDLAFAWFAKYGDKDHNFAVIPDATWAKFQDIWNKVAAGKIDTSAYVK
jgi:basic membrane protein A